MVAKMLASLTKEKMPDDRPVPPYRICAGFSMLSSPDNSKPAPLVVCMQEDASWPCSSGVFNCWDSKASRPPPELTTFQTWLAGQSGSKPPHDYEYTTYATSGNTLGVFFNRKYMSEANLSWSALQYMSTSFPLFQASWWS
jgi:hypothetical protein